MDTLAVLLSDILHLPHSASRGNLKPAKQSFLIQSQMRFIQTAFSFFQIMTAAVSVSLWYKERADFHSFSTKDQFELSPPESRSYFSTDGSSDLDEVNINSTF